MSSMTTVGDCIVAAVSAWEKLYDCPMPRVNLEQVFACRRDGTMNPIGWRERFAGLHVTAGWHVSPDDAKRAEVAP